MLRRTLMWTGAGALVMALAACDGSGSADTGAVATAVRKGGSGEGSQGTAEKKDHKRHDGAGDAKHDGEDGDDHGRPKPGDDEEACKVPDRQGPHGRGDGHHDGHEDGQAKPADGDGHPPEAEADDDADHPDDEGEDDHEHDGDHEGDDDHSGDCGGHPDDHKVQVCHVRPGCSKGPIAIEVDEHAVPAHLGHGDWLVEPEACDGRDNDCDGQVDEDGACEPPPGDDVIQPPPADVIEPPPPEDAGPPPCEGGKCAPDAGPPATDAGQPPADSGTPSQDVPLICPPDQICQAPA